MPLKSISAAAIPPTTAPVTAPVSAANSAPPAMNGPTHQPPPHRANRRARAGRDILAVLAAGLVGFRQERYIVEHQRPIAQLLHRAARLRRVIKNTNNCLHRLAPSLL